MYIKKIQVSRGIVPKSDRQCSTCRNSRVTRDVQEIKTDFSRGYQFAQLAGFPKIVFFGSSYLIFRFRTSRVSEDTLHVLRQSSTCRNSQISKDVRYCSIFPEVTEDV